MQHWINYLGIAFQMIGLALWCLFMWQSVRMSLRSRSCERMAALVSARGYHGLAANMQEGAIAYHQQAQRWSLGAFSALALSAGGMALRYLTL